MDYFLLTDLHLIRLLLLVLLNLMARVRLSVLTNRNIDFSIFPSKNSSILAKL